MARIADKCEHIHMFQRTCVLRDITDPRVMDQNAVYCAEMGTQKHIGVSFTESPHVTDGLEMLHIIAGSCLLYTSPSPRDLSTSRMPSSA